MTGNPRDAVPSVFGIKCLRWDLCLVDESRQSHILVVFLAIWSPVPVAL